MLLGKSCEKRNNILNGKLKLGTLHEYRHTENAEIADQGEGMLNFLIAFDGVVKIEKKWFNTLSGGAITFGSHEFVRFPGRTQVSSRNFYVVRDDATHVWLEDASISIRRESPNSFVFCMSKVEKKSDCHGMFHGYDDYWYISDAKAEEFGVMLGRALIAHIKKEHGSGNSILPLDTDLDKVRIVGGCRCVDYLSRDLHLTGDDTFTLENFMNKMFDMVFIKPESYQGEKEYRFTYGFATLDGKSIEPTVTHLILDSSSLQQFLV